jgi:hypothetical protein
MNRHEKRAAKAMARRQAVDRVVKVHEAGHAVARILVADSLGWSADEALKYIDIGEQLEPEAAAANYGQFYSKPMLEFLQTKMPPEAIDGPHNGTEMHALFSEMRSAGIDVDAWFRARSIDILFGAIAEAKLTGRSSIDVWMGDGCMLDVEDLHFAGFLSGIPEEQLAEVIVERIEIAEGYIARPEVWRAILVLADKIKPGRMNGRVAAAIITRALAQSEVG